MCITCLDRSAYGQHFLAIEHILWDTCTDVFRSSSGSTWNANWFCRNTTQYAMSDSPNLIPKSFHKVLMQCNWSLYTVTMCAKMTRQSLLPRRVVSLSQDSRSCDKYTLPRRVVPLSPRSQFLSQLCFSLRLWHKWRYYYVNKHRCSLLSLTKRSQSG